MFIWILKMTVMQKEKLSSKYEDQEMFRHLKLSPKGRDQTSTSVLSISYRQLKKKKDRRGSCQDSQGEETMDLALLSTIW